MINKLIMDALRPLGIPVTFQKYSGNAETYITFHEYLASGEEFEYDEESITGHYIQIDLWSKGDCTDLVEKTRNALFMAGFRRLTEIDLYEEASKIYHKGMKFYLYEERQVD